MNDGPIHDRLVQIAEARSTAARTRLATTLSLLQSRLSPRALAQEAASNLIAKGQEIANNSVESAKRNPVKVAGIFAAAGLFFARRPLSHLLTRCQHATPSDAVSFNPGKAIAPAKAIRRKTE